MATKDEEEGVNPYPYGEDKSIWNKFKDFTDETDLLVEEIVSADSGTFAFKDTAIACYVAAGAVR